MKTKKCPKCQFVKNLDDFYNDKRKLDGKRGHCKTCCKIISKAYKLNNVNKVKKYSSTYFKNNKDTIDTKRRIRVLTNQEKYKQRTKKYDFQNRDKRRLRDKKRWQTDYLFRLQSNMRRRVNQYLKIHGLLKTSHMFELIGCSPKDLRKYIEDQFTEGMSWGKVGKYIHIDHKIPLCTARSEEELYKLFHYTNLQPLWKKDNLEKGKKLLVTNDV